MIYQPASIEPGTDQTLHPDLHQQGVLVVDDSAVQRTSAVFCLRKLGLSTLYEAGDGLSAVKIYRGLPRPPAVIVLDLELPGLDGIEVLQRLVEAHQKPHVILVSSADDVLINTVATMAQALGIPVLGAFRKPILATAFLQALQAYGPRQNMVRSTEADPTPLCAERLRQAIAEGEIRPYYQPKLALQQGTVAGFEALARWQLPDGVGVSPARFIPLAEESGLIGELTLLLLDQVLEDVVAWRHDGLAVNVALNLSAASLADPNLANEVLLRVARHGVAPRSMTLEITESALVADMTSALATISRLRLRGFGFSIDDYGTGFSSMQQLSRFPFTELKIDRTFVQGAPERAQLRTILQSSLEMARRLGITTVAEGVETETELQLLKAMGCRQVQGYLLARPMPAHKVLEWTRHDLDRVAQLCLQPVVHP